VAVIAMPAAPTSRPPNCSAVPPRVLSDHPAYSARAAGITHHFIVRNLERDGADTPRYAQPGGYWHLLSEPLPLVSRVIQIPVHLTLRESATDCSYRW